MKTFIVTDRLLIREIAPDDAEAILRLDGDPLVLKYINQNPIQNLKQAQDIISFIQQQYR
jgi:RimJ/RimL family protein N-acetyltransferase